MNQLKLTLGTRSSLSKQKRRGKYLFVPVKKTTSATSSNNNVMVESNKKQTISDTKLKQLKTKQALEWLTSTFPDVFSYSHPVPLAIGIHTEIMALHRSQGGADTLGFGWHPVRRALHKWTNRSCYLRLLANGGTERQDIKQVKTVITEDQQVHAKQKLFEKTKSKKH